MKSHFIVLSIAISTFFCFLGLPAKTYCESNSTHSTEVRVNPPKKQFIHLRFGILGGASYYPINKLDLVTITNTNNIPQYELSIKNAKLGIHYGIFSQLFVGAVFVRPEVTFNSNTVDYQLVDLISSSASRIVSEKYQYLDIPILLGIKADGLRINAGPVGHIFISNKSDLTNIAQFSNDFKAMTIGYQAGLGIDFYNFMVDIRYEGNLNKYGQGIIYNGQPVEFSKRPSRIIASLTFAIK